MRELAEESQECREQRRALQLTRNKQWVKTQLAEHERLMRETQEKKERAKEERRAQQLIRKRESQMHYFQNRVRKQVECEKCKKIYASAYSLKRRSLICKH